MADNIIDTAPPSSPSLEEMSGKVMVAAIIVLFLVILFVLFLHLYARWFWSRRGSELHNRHRSRRRFIFTPQDPAIALHRGLEPSVIRSLPVVVFKTEDFKEGLECAVCLCDLEDGEKARLLPQCKHGFHLECIDMWFQSHSTCPLCRNTVGFESKDSSHEPQSVTDEGESTNFPTNVLFWGNDNSLVSARSNGVDQEPRSSSSNERRDGSLVIDIPSRIPDGFSSVTSPSASRFGEEEMKSPMTPMSARLRSLKRLLSREKRVIPSSPSSIDIEQGQGGRGQSSKTISES